MAGTPEPSGFLFMSETKPLTEKPGYYAIIPAVVRYDKRLSANAKLLYGEITCLLNFKNKCFATNAYFARLYEVTEVQISRLIKQLIDAGHVVTLLEPSSTGTQRFISLPININVNTPINKNVNTRLNKNVKHNIQSINTNTSLFNNNEDSDSFKQPEEVKKEEGARAKTLDERAAAFIDIFNKISGDKRRVTSKVKAALKARLKDYNPEEIVKAMKNAFLDPFHKENNFLYVDAEYVLREKSIEKYLHAKFEEPKKAIVLQ